MVLLRYMQYENLTLETKLVFYVNFSLVQNSVQFSPVLD